MEIYLANNFILLFIHNYLVSYIIYRKKTIEYISNFLNMILEKLPLFFRSDSSITECLRDDLVRELVKSKRVDFFFFWLISINKVVDDNVQLRRNGLKIQSVNWSALISIPQCGKNYEIQKLKLHGSLKCLFKFFFPNLKKNSCKMKTMWYEKTLKEL